MTLLSCAGSLLLPGREQACLHLLQIQRRWETVPACLVRNCRLHTTSREEAKRELCFCVAEPAEIAELGLFAAVSWAGAVRPGETGLESVTRPAMGLGLCRRDAEPTQAAVSPHDAGAAAPTGRCPADVRGGVRCRRCSVRGASSRLRPRWKAHSDILAVSSLSVPCCWFLMVLQSLFV